jgi:phage protein D
METIRRPIFKVEYAGKNITSDISSNLIGVTYTDHAEGESDEIEITVEDSEGLWRGDWYPTKGEKMKLDIGYDNQLMPCGTFEVDEIELSGAPDTIAIRGLAAPIKGTLRTKKSSAHENKTLKEIANTIAGKNGLTVTGEIEDVRFTRVTQNRETDLGFLKRISYDYGHVFSVRDKQLIFTTIYKLEEGNPVATIDRSQIASYSLRDKTAKSFAKAEVKYSNPADKKVVEANENETDSKSITKGDTLFMTTKAENKQQAEQKAKAALHRSNSRQQEGSISIEGNPLLVAGNNFELTGMGQLSGKYHIMRSRHRIDRSGGYTTDIEIKRVGYVEVKKQAPKKRVTQKTYEVRVIQ